MYVKIKILQSEEVHVEPSLLAIIREGDAAGDGFVVAFHVEVMADIGVIFVFLRIAFAARDEGFFVFPHHFEVSVRDLDSRFAPRGTEVRAAVLRPFPAVAKVAVSLVCREVIGGFLVGAGLFFFGGKRQGAKVFCRTVFVDFVEAGLTPVIAEKAGCCGGFRGRCGRRLDRRRTCRGYCG